METDDKLKKFLGNTTQNDEFCDPQTGVCYIKTPDGLIEKKLVEKISAKITAAMYEIPDIACELQPHLDDKLAKLYVNLREAKDLIIQLEARYAD